MPDPRFFTVAGPFTLEYLAAVTSAELASGVAPSLLIRDVAPLDHAGPTEISFLDNRKYVDAFSTSKAGACFVHPDLAHRAPSGMALLLTRTPYKAYALAAQALYPPPAPRPGTATTARHRYHGPAPLPRRWSTRRPGSAREPKSEPAWLSVPACGSVGVAGLPRMR